MLSLPLTIKKCENKKVMESKRNYVRIGNK